jgi:hypothetical protein
MIEQGLFRTCKGWLCFLGFAAFVVVMCLLCLLTVCHSLLGENDVGF